MLVFASNSLLYRAAPRGTAIDVVSFTALCLSSGALTFAILSHLHRRPVTPARGDWRGAATLFAYATAFSYTYIQLGTDTGALLLSGAVQVILLLAGLLRDERLGGQALLDFLLAPDGLLFLLLSGASTPLLGGALLMLPSGLAWGLHTLSGRSGDGPPAVSTGNFLRAPVLTALLLLAFHGQLWLGGVGLTYVLLSNALVPGPGYTI